MSNEDHVVELRASGIPRLIECPGSSLPVSIEVQDDGEPARLGTAFHEAVRPLIEIGELDWPSVPDVASRHRVDENELRMLLGLAARSWPLIAPEFPNPTTELPFGPVEIAPGITLKGTLDVASRVGRVGRVLDHKTGRVDRDYGAQIRTYSALMLLDDADLERVDGIVFWLRDGDVERYTMDRAQAREWLERIVSTVTLWDGVYHPGPKRCEECRRSHECAAANKLARRDMAIILDTPETVDLDKFTPDEILELLHRAKVAENIAKRIKDTIKERINARGDIIATDARLTIRDEPRRELDPARTWPVLTDLGWRDGDFAETIKMSISKVEKKVATNAGKGKGAAAVRSLAEKLTAANAITDTFISKLIELPKRDVAQHTKEIKP